ncbi:MAG: shikimate dehydrogenase, partial [Acutalibacteraceae bacterium]
FDLLLNATPVGMYPHSDAMPVGKKTVRRCKAVFDAIYNPRETMLLCTARQNGAQCAYGMPMLVWQAAAAQEIWSGHPFTAAQIAPVIEQANWEMERVFQ